MKRKPSARRAAVTLLGFICAAALATLLAIGVTSLNASAAAERKAEVAAPKPALTVTVVQPQSMPLPLQVRANGNIAAWQEASVGSEANGLRLAEVRVNVGDVVKRGQVLATFSADTVQADVAQARAALAEAEANAADAAGNAERARTLQATGALSQQQINQYQTAEQTAKARVEAAQARARGAAGARRADTQVLAPDDGVISARTATVGAVVPRRHRAVPPDPPGPARVARRGHLGRTRPHRGRHAGRGHQRQRRAGAAARCADRADGRSADAQRRWSTSTCPNALQRTGIKAGMFARGEFAARPQQRR